MGSGYLAETATAHTCVVSIQTALLLLPALAFYIEFVLQIFHNKSQLLTKEEIVSTGTLEGFSFETDQNQKKDLLPSNTRKIALWLVDEPPTCYDRLTGHKERGRCTVNLVTTN